MAATFNIEINTRARANGTHDIRIRITVNRKSFRKNTGITVLKSNYNPKSKTGKWIRTSDPFHEQKNKEIKESLDKEEKNFLQIITKSTAQTPEALFQEVAASKQVNFFAYADSFINTVESAGKYTYAKQLNAVINKLEKFQGGRNLLFTELTPLYLRRFKDYLFVYGNNENTIAGNFKKIRTILYTAIEDGIFKQEKNPFFNFRLPSKPTTKERLTIVELQRIIKLNYPQGTALYNYRNIFLFSLYCAGIRAADVITLKWGNIAGKRLIYSMGKNSKTPDMILIEPALRILNEYSTSNNRPDKYIFPFITSDDDMTDSKTRFKRINSHLTKINKGLKIIAVNAKISKNLSMHIARHSFADIARKGGESIYTISKALQHSSIKVTEAYLNSFDHEATDNLLINLNNNIKNGK